MSFFHPCARPAPDPRLTAVAARHAAAQRRVVDAAEETADRADETREKVTAEVSAVTGRAADRIARKSFGREVTNAALEQMAARVRRDLEGSS